MKNSIDLFDDMMQKYDDTRPEPVIVDESPDAEGMDPELFDGLIKGLQEVIDIESGKIDASDYDIVEIQPNHAPSDVVFNGIPESIKDILKEQPSETVIIKDDGTVDKQKSPNFYDWMING